MLESNKSLGFKIYHISLFIVVLILLSIIYFFINKIDNAFYYDDEIKTIQDIGDNILIESSDNTVERVDLPVRRNADKTYRYHFVPKSKKNGETVCIYVYSDYETFEISSSTDKIYTSSIDESKYSRTGGHVFSIIKLEDKYLDKDLTIEFRSMYPSESGVVVPRILIGSESGLLIYSLKNDVPNLLVFAFLMVTALMVFVISLILMCFKKSHDDILILSIVCFFVGIYMGIHTPSFRMIVDMPNLLYILDYIIFDVGPAFMLIVLLSYFDDKDSLIWQSVVLKCMTLVILLNALIQFSFQIFGIKEYIEMRSIGMYLILFTFILFLTLPLTLNGKKYKFKKTLILSTMPFNLTVVLIAIMYILESYIKWVLILGITTLIFLTFQFVAMFRKYIKDYTEYRTINLYKKLALIDKLTNLHNRNALEKELANIKENYKSIDDILFLFIDINNLKKVNDTYSHNAGDILIRSVADIISSVALNFNHTTAYRYGGDEFVLISYHSDEEKLNAILASLDFETKQYRNTNQDIPLSFSVGYSIETIDEDFNYENMIVNADKKMYQNKRIEKGL